MRAAGGNRRTAGVSPAVARASLRYAHGKLCSRGVALGVRILPGPIRTRFTRKDTLLESVPPGVFTSILPLLAPAGTMAPISESEMTWNTAVVPLKLTPVAPLRWVPES